jgi:hypothetical protein
MKKILVVFAILSTMILASCGGKAVETDSTSVDSTEVVVDTTVVEGTEVVGGGAEIVETEAPQGEAVK